jgi:hypothetical protein
VATTTRGSDLGGVERHGQAAAAAASRGTGRQWPRRRREAGVGGDRGQRRGTKGTAGARRRTAGEAAGA